MTTLRLLIATVLATLGLAAPALAASAGDMLLVSRPSTFGALNSPATNDSFSARDDGDKRTIADGHRYVVFMSDADGMVPDDDNHFTNVSDVEDLSRLLTLEVMVHRWSNWLTQGFDYLAGRVNETELKSNIKEYSVEIRLVKASLGIDRAQREKDKGETLGDYVANLLDRAKEFGVHRDEQYAKAVTYLWQLISMINTYDRCDEQERRELDLSSDSMIQWVREQVMPEWAGLNQAFRANQKIWISDL